MAAQAGACNTSAAENAGPGLVASGEASMQFKKCQQTTEKKKPLAVYETT